MCREHPELAGPYHSSFTVYFPIYCTHHVLSSASVGSVSQQARRGMATEKQIFNQINSTKNIKKITSSMKMVSAAKLKGDENRLAAAVPFNAWTSNLCPEPKLIEDATFEELPDKVLIVPFTSDKGLCGGVNSFVTRSVKNMLTALESQGKSGDIVVIGDKGRGQLRRTHGDKILRSATDVDHVPYHQ